MGYPASHDPPDVLYLGIDTDTGKVQVTWWIWRMMDDDIVYIRKDLADKKYNELKEKYEELRKSIASAA